MADTSAPLRNVHRAIIAPAKVRDYLLTDAADKGAGKPGFFLRFGFTRARWDVLAEALRAHAMQHPARYSGTTRYGDKYTVRGLLATPDGRNPEVVTVWQYDIGSDLPKLVTAYPAS